MKIDSVHILFWSYSGTTEAFAAHMAADIRARGWEPRLCNLLKDKPDTVSFSQRDLLIMLCPVFAGRLPAHAAAFLKSLSGDRAPALAAVAGRQRQLPAAQKPRLLPGGRRRPGGAAFHFSQGGPGKTRRSG